MDSTTSLKRRRPHSYCDGPYDSYSQTACELPPQAILGYTTREGYILEQAAAILQVTQAELCCLSPPLYNSYVYERGALISQFNPLPDPSLPFQHQYAKRQRKTYEPPSAIMPQHDTEDCSSRGLGRLGSPMSFFSGSQAYGQEHTDSSNSDSDSFLAFTGMAGCFAGLATCYATPKHQSPEQEMLLAQPVTEVTAPPESCQLPYHRPQAGLETHGIPAQVNEPYLDDFVTTLLPDDGLYSTSYLQSYPALQPTIVPPTTTSAVSELTWAQPSTHAENMCYQNGNMSDRDPNLNYGDGRELATAFSVVTPTLSVPSHVPPLHHTPMQQSSGEMVFAGGPRGQVATNYRPIAVQPVATTGGGHVPASAADNALCLAADALPGPAVLNTAVVPHYRHEPLAVSQHPQQYHHPMRKPVPITTNLIEANAQTTERSNQRPSAVRRGPFKDQTSRLKTAQTRRDGSCIRCRMQRIRCNADGDDTKGQCLGCKKPYNRMWRAPCLRLKINDVVLAKTTQVKGHEWTLRWKDNTILDNVGQWASGEVRTLRVTEGYTNRYVELRVRMFVPQAGDSLTRSWVAPDGTKRSVRIPPFAVIEPETIAPLYNNYIKQGLSACCSNVLSGLKNTLVWPTYEKALHLGYTAGVVPDQERNVLSAVLELWMSVRLTTRSFEIVGDETLGMPRDILDKTSPSPGKVPIPPVMGAQLDSVLIHDIQQKLRRTALERLWEIISENKRERWLTIYLATFILLHNASLIIRHDASYARKHGINRRFAREEKVQEYYTGAVTLLAYFHYLKGEFPFTEAARDADIAKNSILDEAGMQFVRETRAAVLWNKQHWQKLWDTDAYEDDFYFISQMYEENWQPRSMKI